MATTPIQLNDISTFLASNHPAIVRLPKIAAPFTTVVNRALMTNFANDLLPRMGVDRTMIQQIIEVQGESGPNGERIFKPINDVHDQVRMVGSFFTFNDSSGQYFQAPSASTAYWEITFYGTGLNVLVGFNSTADRSVNVTVDGGSPVLTAFTGTTGSTVLNGRNYSLNMVFAVASNLTLGMHTVKIANNGISAHIFSGFESVISSSSLQLVPGQAYNDVKRLNKSTLSTSLYNSVFEAGTLGARGGRVLVYQKADGSVAKTVNPTNASAAFLGSATHVNEEMVRSYYYREFGAGRADDVSLAIPATVNKAFTTDDGTTTIVGNDIRIEATADGLQPFTNGSAFVHFTFVGTGLDVMWAASAAGTNTNANAFEWYVDGVSVGNLTTISPGAGVQVLSRVVSGLPYGTHHVRLLRNAPNTWTAALSRFNVYVPSKPALPSGAVELSEYCIAADYVANTVAGASTIATGILRKHATREFKYAGTWAAAINGAGLSSDDIGGWELFSSTNGDYLECTFFGTGFEHRFSVNATSSTWQYTIDGSTNLSGFTTSTYGTFTSFTAATGTLVTAASAVVGGGVRVSGLALGIHTVRVTKTAGTGIFYHTAFECITPIHSVKMNGPIVVQNTLSVGSQGIRDLRNFGEQQISPQKMIAQAVGVSSAPTISTSFTPVADMTVTLKTTGRPITVSYSASITSAAGQNAQVQVYVNGVAVNIDQIQADADILVSNMAGVFVVPLSAGFHSIKLYATSSSSSTASGTRRTLTVEEK